MEKEVLPLIHCRNVQISYTLSLHISNLSKMLNKKIQFVNIIFILFLNRPFVLSGRLPVEEEEIPLCSSGMTVAECSKGKFDRVRCC